MNVDIIFGLPIQKAVIDEAQDFFSTKPFKTRSFIEPKSKHSPVKNIR